MLELEIKKAADTHLTALSEIGVASYLPHYKHLWNDGGVEWYMNRCFGDDNLRREMLDDNVEYYFLQSSGANVGILKLILQKPLPDSEIESALYLEKIYFVKEFTGKGAGKSVIEFVVNRAAELNRQAVWLMAMDSSEKPIAAYRKSGFVEHGRTRLDDDEFNLMKPEFRGMVILKREVK